MAITTAIVGGLFSGLSYMQQQEAAGDARDAANRQAAAQREQAAISARQADIQNSRQARAAMRQARIQRAVVANTGANAGTIGSSGVQGGLGSIDSQGASNLGYFGQMKELNQQTTVAQGQQADAIVAGANANADYQEAGALGKIGSSIFDAGGGFKTIFSKVN